MDSRLNCQEPPSYLQYEVRLQTGLDGGIKKLKYLSTIEVRLDEDDSEQDKAIRSVSFNRRGTSRVLEVLSLNC
jgi:hypothetical protein